MYFDSSGQENTGEVLKLVVQEAKKRQISHIVVASDTGTTALSLAEEVGKQGYDGKLVCVTQAYGYKGNGKCALSEENREKLEKLDIKICTAAHILSGSERSLSRKFQGIYPVEIIAYSLRMFGEGTKVCVEISVMALDAGLIPYGKPVIALGGSSRGADTASILTPDYTSSILSTKIHEILCKPRN